jgi:hypothetical protein
VFQKLLLLRRLPSIIHKNIEEWLEILDDYGASLAILIYAEHLDHKRGRISLSIVGLIIVVTIDSLLFTEDIEVEDTNVCHCYIVYWVVFNWFK